ncbi:MAG: L,D-transpeptidase [Verrucomicrobia bacterium]|nr:L,D-transpeptidase [Verrucomicrobiota bacterium]
MNAPPEFLQACKRNGIVSTRFILVVSVAKQTVSFFDKFCGLSLLPRATKYKLLKSFPCSTSRFGIGQVADTNCTPLGLHRVAEKIGGGWPVGTVFRSRKAVGFTWRGLPLAKITNRILWLEGLETGFNRGGNVDSHSRYIYIHGTGEEPTLGRPASHGCIHLAAQDLLPLFDKMPVGTLVWITR